MKRRRNWKPARCVDGTGSRSNRDRADMAASVVEEYARLKDTKGMLVSEELSRTISDLVADLFHYVASLGHNPDVISKTALRHFESER